MTELAERFFKRFAGLERAHGRYAVGKDLKPDPDGKANKFTGPRGTRHEPVTTELWEQHLKGSIGIGIVPIKEDQTVSFAAIDVDIYPIDLVALQGQVVKLGLPAIVTRTKSGGAHIYVFFKKGVTAEEARTKLQSWLPLLNLKPDTEIFPKQTSQGADSTGNWINMPYQNAEGPGGTSRYGVKPDGSAMTPDEYLKLANHLALGVDELASAGQTLEEAVWEGAPPCLVTLASTPGGFAEYRNNAIFNLAVYARKRFGDNYLAVMPTYASVIQPPLGPREVQITWQSSSNKTYNYRCKDAPINAVCQRTECLKRRYGVSAGRGTTSVQLGEKMIRLVTDPPTFIWEINDQRIEFLGEELVDQKRFKLKLMNAGFGYPTLPKPGEWLSLINQMTQDADVIKAPEDATREGQLWGHLADFCTSKVKGKDLDEILLGKPYTDEERSYFRGTDFMQYLIQHRVTGVTERDLWRWLRRMNADHHNKSIKGKGTYYWSVPAFKSQTEDFNIPRKPPEETM